MDKLKNIFHHNKTGDSHHSDAAAAPAGTTSTSTGQQQEAAQLYPTEAGQKEHGVLRQVLNPGGDKYDSTAHGTTATTDASQAAQPSEYKYGQGQHTIIDQIVNPGTDKYDAERFSETPNAPVVSNSAVLATDEHEKKHQHSILRQILNPGGAKYDQEGYGSTAHVVSDSSNTNPSSTAGVSQTNQPSAAHSSNVQSAIPSNSAYTQSGALNAPQSSASTQVLPDRTAAPPATTNLHSERDSAVAGAAGGAAAYGLGSHQYNPSSTVPQESYAQSETKHTPHTAGVTSGVAGIGSSSDNSSSIMNRPHPLAAAATADETAVPTSSVFGGPSSVVAGPGEGAAAPVAHIDLSHQVGASTTAAPSANYNAGAGSVTSSTHGSTSYNPALAAALAATGAATGAGAYHHAQQPRAPTGTAVVAPTETVSSMPLAGATASQQHSTAHDATASYGATSLGSQSQPQPVTGTATIAPPETISSTHVSGATSSAPSESATTGSYPAPTTSNAGPTAAGVGAGAAAGAGYEASQGRGDTGPATKTIGPHSSKIANVLDPRVQPDPEKMKDHTTAGVHRSDIANKLDPRVEADPTKAAQQQQSSSHAAAPVGAATAGAATGAGIAEHEHEHDDHESKQRNRLHKERKDGHSIDDGEKKPSLIHRILHPGEKHQHDNQSSSSPSGVIDAETQRQLHREEAQKPFATEPVPANLDPRADASGTAATLGVDGAQRTS